IGDCLRETGLDRGITCTTANLCQSCQIVPSCNKVLYNAGGPGGIFATGIASFGSQYTILNNSFNTVYSLLNRINVTNQVAARPVILADFNNISTISSLIYQNPIFPPTQNITSQQFQACSSYVGGGAQSANVPASNAPWYCNALGYCQFTTYNYTALPIIQNQINNLAKLTLSDPQILSIASNSSQIAASYLTPVVGKQKSAQLNAILNTTLITYPTLVNNTQFVLAHISNATVSAQLTELQSRYANLVQNYLAINFTSATNRVLDAMGTLEGNYTKLNGTYYILFRPLQNSTSLVLKTQLDSRTANPAAASVAYSQISNLAAMNGQVGNVPLMSSQINATYKSAQSAFSSFLPFFSLTEFARSVDSPFVNAIAPLVSTTYSGAVASVPLLAALFSLIIGIIVLVLVYLFKRSLGSKRKLVHNQRSARGWRTVFVAIILLTVLDMAANYVYAGGANSFAPATSFTSAVAASHLVVIAINGTATPAELLCQSRIAAALSAMGKNTSASTISNNSCLIGNTTKTLSTCQISSAKSGSPTIILTSSANPNVKIYSFYGTSLSVMGDDNVMSACYPLYLLK
ncbi:MAG: hypothetical protein KGH65_05745, partial [Candidatus Micrarchaeota archaeon]|nr:hypothetical protein [Candidatus Micrarchaeota archaeon]